MNRSMNDSDHQPTSLTPAQTNPSSDDLRLAKPNRFELRRAALATLEARPFLSRNEIRDVCVGSMPPIRRVSMAPSKLDRHPLHRLWRKIATRKSGAVKAPTQPDRYGETTAEPAWRRAAKHRRIVLALLVAAQTLIASWSLARTFPTAQLSDLEVAVVAIFTVLFAWISFSFWTNIAGFWTLWRKQKIYSLPGVCGEAAQQPLRSRTAVLMPICNEEVSRCFAGIGAIYQSLAETGQLEKFDFYVLSDTSDATRQLEEQISWEQTCRRLNGFGKIFYRHRRNNIKRKSGNIADFLRRWSRNYDFMIVLDADSLMSGEIMVRLARMMELSPQAGIIQSAPTIVNRESLFARVQQFAGRVYGPLFSASLAFWQLGESYYWGHNAIIRIAPFVKHCGLARLPGKPPLGGEILSHDFVEAALMGRAGLQVWLAHDLTGSYEESPPNILDELKRDRRWCQGNLQHLRLLFGDGIRFGHRAIMAMGVMAYASALLWAVFLVLSSAEVIIQALTPPVYFPPGPSLFPRWPIWHPELTIALLTTTGLLLILPKFLSFALILKNRQVAGFGGALRLAVGIVLEIIFSTLVAPLRMWFHSKFVLLTLFGRQIKWHAQTRNDAETDWWEAVRHHGFSTLIALTGMAGGLYWNETLAWWLLPVSISLLLAVPLSVYSSRIGLGRAIKRWQLFRVPEERDPPPVLQGMEKLLAKENPGKEHRRTHALKSDRLFSTDDRLPNKSN